MKKRISHRPVRWQQGFTIVETMIVLAVTGLLFVSIATVIAGRQGKVQFQQAINEVKTELKQAMSEAQSGYYPSQENFTCRDAGPRLEFPSRTPGSADQGTNDICVFLGKVVQFSSVSDPQLYIIHSLAGRNGAENFDTSKATVIPWTSDKKQLKSGLQARYMRARHGAGNYDVGAVAFVSSFGKNQGSGMMYGSQSLQIVAINHTRLSHSDTDTALINSNIKGSYNRPEYLNPDGGVEICLESGTSRQSGLITIGGKGRMNAVTLAIKETPDCS